MMNRLRISALNRKLVRDVWEMKGQALAIAAEIGEQDARPRRLGWGGGLFALERLLERLDRALGLAALAVVAGELVQHLARRLHVVESQQDRLALGVLGAQLPDRFVETPEERFDLGMAVGRESLANLERLAQYRLGLFDGADAVVFYAQPELGRYAGFDVYQLALAGGGARMASHRVEPAFVRTATSFSDTLRVERDLVYRSDLPDSPRGLADPPGVDRAAVHERLNAEMAAFFRRSLTPK